MVKQAGQFMAVGLEMGLAVFIGIVLGHFLDDYFDTKPVFFWIGFGLGILTAAKALYDATKKAKKIMDE